MKTLTSALSSALGGPVQRPTFLVQVDFSVVQRWTSGASLFWNGQSWAARHMNVENLVVQALRVQGTLILGNEVDDAGTLVLGQGVKDRRIQIYGYDAAATADVDDIVWLCDAVGAAARIGPREVRIELRHRLEFVQSPRTYVEPAAGFNNLLPADTVLRINGIDMRLERR